MNLPRFLACAVGLVSLGLSLYAYAEYIRLLGFPDSHLTALGSAERRLAAIFIALSLLFNPSLIYLALVANRRNVGGSLAVAVVWYLLVLAGTVALAAYLRSHLDGGIGG